jgi:hypothetical protein
MSSMSSAFRDALDPDATDRPDFDRFYFNLHGTSRSPLFLVMGAGVYPQAGLVDGYLCAVIGVEQRNLRASDAIADGSVGPMAWEVLEPRHSWRLSVAPNPTGVELDVVWTARAPVHEVEQYRVEGASDYSHYFQSGRYAGEISIDGRVIPVQGWLGQRDRSRGRRGVRDRLGLHLWIQAQLEEECIGFLYNEDRDGRPVHLDGAIMREDGGVVRIAAVRHALEFSDDFELRSGRFDIELDDGNVRDLTMESTGGGLYMAGAGYDGWHGVDHGPACVEHDRWPLDGTRTPRNLGIGFTDALCGFRSGPARGSGIAEYALTRSPQYVYTATKTR